MELVKYLNLNFSQTELTVYDQKQFPLKIPPYKFEGVLHNTSSYFDESCSPNYEHLPKSMDLTQNTSPLFN